MTPGARPLLADLDEYSAAKFPLETHLSSEIHRNVHAGRGGRFAILTFSSAFIFVSNPCRSLTTLRTDEVDQREGYRIRRQGVIFTQFSISIKHRFTKRSGQYTCSCLCAMSSCAHTYHTRSSSEFVHYRYSYDTGASAQPI